MKKDFWRVYRDDGGNGIEQRQNISMADSGWLMKNEGEYFVRCYHNIFDYETIRINMF